MDSDRNVPYRRIGTILVDRRLISADQLATALVEQEATGRPLGEICVERYGLDRLTLADALTEQWEEMQRAGEPTREGAADEVEAPVGDAVMGQGRGEADELRVLLEEAEAARAELVSKTDELGRRLALLETLVIGVSDALAELRPVAHDRVDGDGADGHGHGHAPRRAKRPRGAGTARRAASA